MRTLFIIPAFNEARNIASIICEIKQYHENAEIIVVDDGSCDETADIAEKLGSRVIKHPFNLGYGAAIQTGLCFALEENYEACVLLDGDGQHDPKFISDLLEPVHAGKADIALGSRFLGTTDYSVPLLRKIGIRLFGKLASIFTRQEITDPTSGFQAIGPRLMKFFVNDNYPYDYPDADTLIRLSFAGFKIQEIPVKIRSRLAGESMHSGARTLYYIYKMLFSIFIAITQKSSIEKEQRHAIRDETGDCHHQPVHTVDHYSTGAKKSAG